VLPLPPEERGWGGQLPKSLFYSCERKKIGGKNKTKNWPFFKKGNKPQPKISSSLSFIFSSRFYRFIINKHSFPPLRSAYYVKSFTAPAFLTLHSFYRDIFYPRFSSFLIQLEIKSFLQRRNDAAPSSNLIKWTERLSEEPSVYETCRFLNLSF
jgi:hypothetical protein